MEELLQFYNYLKHPVISLKSTSDSSSSLSKSVQLFVLIFILEILFLFPLLAVIGVDELPHAFEMLKDTQTGWMIAGLAIIIAPIVEECIFRLPLKSPRTLMVYLFIFLGFVIFIITEYFFPSSGTLITAISGISLGVLFVYLLSQNGILKIFSNRNNYPMFFYLIAIIFAFIHIFNFDLDYVVWWKGPVLVLPQFLLALVLGYIRIRFGLIYSIFIHALNNAIPISMLFIFKAL